MTPVALKQGPCLQLAVRGVSAVGADKTTGPAHRGHGLTALRFGTIPNAELRETGTLLKLNCIDQYGAISLFFLYPILALIAHDHG